jgi:hypothetical protein
MAAGAAVVSACIALPCSAQAPADDVMVHALQIVGELEDTQRCDISLHGTPRLDELTDRWLVAYSGVGPACDDMGAALQRAGMPAEITFFRRPNSDEVKALVGRLRATVRRGFPCQLSINGEPQFDADADLWIVRYYASGDECEAASAELVSQGKAYRIAFQRVR